jgi:poly-gamma-glutamate synthesis protein (capsule biosynthesis protein)
VLPRGYEATKDKVGCAPMRVSTFYEAVDGQPGMPPRIITLANKEDLEMMKADIKKVRPLVDVVIMSIHWGLHLIPACLAMYEKEVGHAAIDAGVDLIFGQHPHILKGIEIYKGKVIFYSMGNFAVPWPRPAGTIVKYPLREMLSFVVDPEYSSYGWHPDCRKTLIAKCIISNKKITRVSLLPCMINKQAQPEILLRSDKRSSEVLEYIDWCCRDQDLNARFCWDDDEAVINL